MKFTKDTLKQLIAEEVENYLNEQARDEPYRAPRKEIERALAKLVAMAGDEDLGDTYTPLPAGPEKEFPGTPEGIPGFERDNDDVEESSLAPTQEVPHLARTPIGRKPRKSPETRFLNKK